MIQVRSAHGGPGSLTKDDVWGLWDEDTFSLISKGMIVARGLPSVDDRYFTQEKRNETISRAYPDVCPVWGDQLPYKSVTAICDADQVEGVSYWLEYVHGGGSVSDFKELPDGKVAIRSNYMCW